MEGEGESTVALVGYMCLFLGFSSCILIKIDEKQPGPYMDEVFHVPQSQKYCSGNFTQWDPMITTLPGLYLTSVGVLKPLAFLLKVTTQDICQTFWLRSLNVAFGLGNVFLLSQLTSLIGKLSGNGIETYEPPRRLATSIALSLFPVLYFFCFLYYTDSGSTFCVLLMYLLSLHNNHTLAALIGVVAIFFRQTNIVWVIFVAALALSQELIEYVNPKKNDIPASEMQNMSFVVLLVQHVWRGLKSNSKLTRVLIVNCLKLTWPYILVGLAFLTFIVVNGGIVVGAKDDHQASLHFPQVFYFVSFTTVFSFMHLVTFHKFIKFVKFMCSRPLLTMLFCFVSAILVWKFTFAHRYLLADNRHYTFYLWAKLYRRHYLLKYIVIPAYFYATWSILDSVQEKGILWKISYCLCTVINLVPQMLLEFRYFILPYIILRVNMKNASYLQLLLEITLYVAVNTATLYLFLERPFVWENSEDLQRFMW